jgi:hypothetical protein
MWLLYLACAIASGEGSPPFVEILNRRTGTWPWVRTKDWFEYGQDLVQEN